MTVRDLGTRLSLSFLSMRNKATFSSASLLFSPNPVHLPLFMRDKSTCSSAGLLFSLREFILSFFTRQISFCKCKPLIFSKKVHPLLNMRDKSTCLSVVFSKKSSSSLVCGPYINFFKCRPFILSKRVHPLLFYIDRGKYEVTVWKLTRIFAKKGGKPSSVFYNGCFVFALMIHLIQIRKEDKHNNEHNHSQLQNVFIYSEPPPEKS